MSSDTLPNYIRSARKATGLSVKDLAQLLGHSSGSCVSHYEGFHRTPSLATALLLHLALEKPMHELFQGLHAEAQQAIKERADALLEADYRSGRLTVRESARDLWLRQLAGHEQESLPL